ncbi:hypothetical protein AM593_00735, partial [Mytilus galloprovincialis]
MTKLVIRQSIDNGLSPFLNEHILSGKIQRGRHGHDVILVLDCSDRMRGQKFTIMIEAAKTYVNGIKQVRMTRLLEDNIGLAVFGGTSGLLVESTSNYDLVLEKICEDHSN